MNAPKNIKELHTDGSSTGDPQNVKLPRWLAEISGNKEAVIRILIDRNPWMTVDDIKILHNEQDGLSEYCDTGFKAAEGNVFEKHLCQ